MMKKLLAPLAMLFFGTAHAYDGATRDFMAAFYTSLSESVADAGSSNAKEHLCLAEAFLPVMEAATNDHIQSLPKYKVALMDDFFDRPLGQEMMSKVRLAGHQGLDLVSIQGLDLYEADVDALDELSGMFLDIQQLIALSGEKLLDIKDECSV